MTDTPSERDADISRSPTLDEWKRLEPIIDAVLDAPPARRPSLLAELSNGDAARRSELERMVAECERDYPLLEQPVGERFSALFTDDTFLIPESLADRYRVEREVGRGGMAIVYLAHDLRHGRDVAVKVVRPEIAASLGRARFLREIEIAARLRHPNIVPVYDSGEVADTLYYVMPFEVGDSLRRRLDREGRLPLDVVVTIIRDVCDALEYAHQQGIVHRDIKPDNVLLSGRHALVADFGIARAVSEATTDARTAGLTATASHAVGTPAYMAPEQAANVGVDRRADIYAVGVLAYELLSGSPRLDESLRVQRPDVPQALESLILKCLARNPDDRWQSASDVLAQLEPISVSTVAPASANAPRAKRMAVSLGIAIAGVVVAVVVAARAIDSRRTRGTASPISIGRASQLTSDPGLEVQPSISPDGRMVAYAAGHSLQMRIFVRPAAGGKPIRLTPDTVANEWLPRWSPDGTRILFLSKGSVFSAPSSGGQARAEIASRPGAVVVSASWSPNGQEISYVRGDSLLSQETRTGNTRLITTGGDLHSCAWSPNGARLACVSGNYYYVTVGAILGLGPMFGNLAPSRIVLVPARGGAPVSVTDSGSLHQSPVWSPDGRTLYYVSNRQGPRDVYALNVGDPVSPRGQPARVTTGLGAHSINFSNTGTQIVYAVYRSSANAWAVPIPSHPPASASAAAPLTSGNQTVEGIRVSPDRRFLVYDSDVSGNSEIYRMPLNGGDPERLTNSASDKFRGAISPDGRELTYHTFQTGARNVFSMPLGGGAARQITFGASQRSMANWSPDGRALALFDMTTSRVLVMRRDGAGNWREPRALARDGWRPEWSPDGRLIAFVSPTAGRIGVVPADSGAQRDVYVPGPNDPLAELAIFSPSGRELYFKSHDARGSASFWSIPVEGGRPRLLLRLDDPTRASNRFDFASDGKRFYFTIEDRQSDIWLAEVVRR